MSKWSSGFVAAIAAACAFLSPFSVRAALTPFKDAANGDYHLAKGSAAINACTYGSWMDAAKDLDGKGRVKFVKRDRTTGEVKQGFVDIGCYESKWSGTGLSVIIK